MGCLHLQFAERLPSARRGGKLRAQANSVNSGCAGNHHRSLFVERDSEWSRLGRAKFFDTLFSVFKSTRTLLFAVKKNFSVKIENKIIFFLSLSQLISSLKPAGESSHKQRVNKL
jgi:hypothetical protein